MAIFHAISRVAEQARSLAFARIGHIVERFLCTIYALAAQLRADQRHALYLSLALWAARRIIHVLLRRDLRRNQ